MLYLYPSNKTENLAYLIAEIIDRHPLSSTFKAETILIQSQGMGTWLQQELSNHSGVAALIDCKMPASFVWRLAQELLPEQPHIPIFEKNNLRWELFRRIPGKLDEPAYQLLKHYLHGQSTTDTAEIRAQASSEDTVSSASNIANVPQKVLFELSGVIADVFDAYQNYRPDWIEAWEKGSKVFDRTEPGLAALEAWQSDLWCSVYPELALSQRQHRSRLFAKLIERLTVPTANLKSKLPERLFIFGLSALPPHWLSLMTALGKHLDIHFMVHNPCQYYWGDVLTPVQQLKLEQSLVAKGVSVSTAADTFLEGNPLLASWGKLGRDYLSLLSSFPGIEEVPATLFDDVHDAAELTALGWLQSDILNLQARDHVVSLSDDSIRFASCHSHLREVEALHDYLFHLLDQHPELKPKDIIVMMPDVQDFAALIEAVFSRPAYDSHGRPQYLAYGISDQRLSMDQPLLDTLADLLSLSSARVTGAQVLDWLEMPAIRARFCISETELEDIKQWIKHLNIRWGLSEAHRDQLLRVKGSGAGNTWLSACRRLLAGYLFGQDEIVSYGEQALLAFPQRSPERQILAGKLMRFLDVIEASIRLQFKTFKLTQWLAELSELWQSWLDFEQVAPDIQQLLSHFETALEAEIACTGFDQGVSFSVIASVLNAQFDNQRVSQRFLAGRINFCTLMPMRSIPFKVVCMLGLNEGAYPRPVQRQSFDLLAATPARIGDRSRREDDRYLFLEALCSARAHLYLSYCGRDIQDNSERFPSLLVSELRAYCAQHFSLKDTVLNEAESILDLWTACHHLQPFHPDYFYGSQSASLSATARPLLEKTFASEWLALMNAESGMNDSARINHVQTSARLSDDLAQPEPEHASYPIALASLLDCASHPLRYYYQTVLQVNLRDIDEELSNSEPFSVYGLAEYSLKKELTQNWFVAEQEAADSSFSFSRALMQRWQLADKLPRPPLDQFYVNALSASLQPMYHYIAQTLPSAPCYHELDCQLGKYHLSGSLLTFGDCLIELGLSKKPGASFFSFWVKHVFWSLICRQKLSVESSQGSRFIGPETEVLIPLLPEQQALEYAIQLCDFFASAARAPYVFLPKTTYALLFESSPKAQSTFQSNQHIPGENLDAYWQRYCLMSETLAENQSVADWQVMPDIEASVFFQQIEAVKEQFAFNKLSLPVTDESKLEKGSK